MGFWIQVLVQGLGCRVQGLGVSEDMHEGGVPAR